jgi:hypothetical protein
LFEINQQMDCVLIGEPVSQMLTMLIDSPDKIVGDANVQGPADLAGEDIDPVTAISAQTEGPVDTGSSAFADDDAECAACAGVSQ